MEILNLVCCAAAVLSSAEFKIAPGFELRLFADEQHILRPRAMAWDEQARLWVLEAADDPFDTRGRPKRTGRIQIVEDLDADGRADKATIFAKGLSSVGGMALGNGGIYV